MKQQHLIPDDLDVSTAYRADLLPRAIATPTA
jgi:hypothetical protein